MAREHANGWLINTHDNQAYRLFVGDTAIGRSPQNDIVVADPSVSREHALIRYQNDSFFLINRGAHVPLRVNGFEVYSPVRLEPQDKIEIGETLFRFASAV